MVPINYMAVVVAAIASMVVGSLWYGPLFGKQWIALSGMSPEAVAAGKAKGMKGMWKSYVFMFVGSLVMAYVLSHALVFSSAYLNAAGVSAGLMTGFWNWLGFIVPVKLGSVLWEGKSWKLFVLDTAYYLVTLCIMGAMLALWA